LRSGETLRLQNAGFHRARERPGPNPKLPASPETLR
jgi:hypothetical protein